MREIIIQNNKIEQDSGVYFGRGVFETILIKEKIEFWDFHLKRLNEGLKKIGLEEVQENLKEIVEELNLKNIVLKIIVTEKNVIIKSRKIPYKKEDYEKGFKLTRSKVLRNSTSVLNKIKSLNYLENILEREKAIGEGFNDCLFINEKGNICETSTANIFFVKKNEIYTPDIKEGLLNGCLREFIIKNFDVKIKNFKWKDLKEIDEIFITNSIIGIMKINSIDNYMFTKENIGSLIRKEYLEIDIVEKE
ncbi:aminotransferase class IV [uncultured Clostridium sp.]|uniref:aminotransferase class IV n=1 Tax=uncultured Clostridium sp. TaxID=59620 RepID=UPI00262E94D2|nr:aminotransferase class IV [uncultured Clostridium sp.]